MSLSPPHTFLIVPQTFGPYRSVHQRGTDPEAVFLFPAIFVHVPQFGSDIFEPSLRLHEPG